MRHPIPQRSLDNHPDFGILMTDFTTTLNFIWNDNHKRVTHIVPSIAGFDADEEVPTVCGAVTMYADFGTPEYPICEECQK